MANDGSPSIHRRKQWRVSKGQGREDDEAHTESGQEGAVVFPMHAPYGCESAVPYPRLRRSDAAGRK